MIQALYQSSLKGKPAFNGRINNLPNSILKEQNKLNKNAYACANSLSLAYEKYVFFMKNENKKNEISNEEKVAFATLKEELDMISKRVEAVDFEENNRRGDPEFSIAFHVAKGWEAPLEFVFLQAIPCFLNKNGYFETRKTQLTHITNASLLILKDLCCNVPELGEILGARDDLICILMTTLTEPSIHEMCGVFCEELLSGRRGQVFDLRKINNLSELIHPMNAVQILLFCRIVSFVTLDPEERLATSEGKNLKSFSLLEQRRYNAIAERSGNDLVARNHLCLLQDCPEFLVRLVQLLEEFSNLDDLKKLWLGKDSTCWGVKEKNELQQQQQTTRLNSLEEEVLIQQQQQQQDDASSPFILLNTFRDANIVVNLAIAAKNVVIHAISYVRNREIENNNNNPKQSIFKRFKRFIHNVLNLNQVVSFNNQLPTESNISVNVVETLPTNESGNTHQTDDHSSFWSNDIQRNLWLLSQRLEVVYILCTMCLGPHKKQVQDRLRQLNLVSALIQRFDKLVWDPNFRAENLPESARLHGLDCECNPHGALRAQILRLIHNFCDRESDNESNKKLLFSSVESNSLNWDFSDFQEGSIPHFGWERIQIDWPPPPPIQQLPPPTTTTNNTAQQLLLSADALKRSIAVGFPGGCPQDRGLAWRIAAVLVSDNKPNRDPSFRFWVCAALEALLRGSLPKVKIIICSWGVLYSIVNSILTEESQISSDSNQAQKSEILQTSFDLLGELVKDNPLALSWLCGNPCPLFGSVLPDDTFTKICEIATNHLVDGNVFLRAIALTTQRNPFNNHLIFAKNWILRDNVVKLLKGLWNVVTLDTVSQENLCCLNTAVVLLTFARKEGNMKEILCQVKNFDQEKFPVFNQQLLSLKEKSEINFRKLLWFWRCYYSCRTVDRKSLEHSSGMKFEDLVKTVQVLCDLEGDHNMLYSGTIHIPYIGNALPVATKIHLDAWGDY